MSSRIIAVSGWKGSGKDTLASHLVSAHGYEQLSFANALKDSVAKQYNIHRSMMDDPLLKDEPLLHLPVIPSDPFTQKMHVLLADFISSGYWTPRALCVLEGSIKRAVYANYWVSRVVEVIKQNPDKKYVISDLRYQSEADTLRMLIPEDELLVMRIHRYQDMYVTDPSERDLDNYKFDLQIANLGSIDDFKKNIDTVLTHLDRYKK